MSEVDPILRAGASLVVCEYVDLLLQASRMPDYPGAPRLLGSLSHSLNLWRLARGFTEEPTDTFVMVDALLYAKEHESDVETYINQHDKRQEEYASGQQ